MLTKPVSNEGKLKKKALNNEENGFENLTITCYIEFQRENLGPFT